VERCVVIVGNDPGDVSESQISREVCAISLQREDHLRSLEALPTAMRYESEACVPVSGNQVYVTGVGENRKETWKLDPESGWTRCGDMIQGRRRHCATFVNNTTMYVLGGIADEHHDRTVLDSVEKFDTETNTWTAVGTLNHTTYFAACVVHHNSIYIFGGRCDLDKSSLRCVQVFNTTSGVCTDLPQCLPRRMQMLRAAIQGTFVIIIGKNECVIFDLKQETFKERRQFATGVNQFGLLVENERVFLIGGHTKVKRADGTAIRPSRDDVLSVAVKDIINNSPAEWSHHATLPQPAFIHAFAVLTLPRI